MVMRSVDGLLVLAQFLEHRQIKTGILYLILSKCCCFLLLVELISLTQLFFSTGSICPHVRKRVQPTAVHLDYSVIPRPVVENWEERGHTCESSQEVLTYHRVSLVCLPLDLQKLSLPLAAHDTLNCVLLVWNSLSITTAEFNEYEKRLVTV